MIKQRTLMLTVLALCAFAANSLLCRLALRDVGTDPASFTAVRLTAGAAILWLIARFNSMGRSRSKNWRSALALFTYAAAFSFAYVTLPAGVGALLLFGAVQLTMIVAGLWAGERPGLLQICGLMLAMAGLVYLLLPGLSAPPLTGAVLMLGAGAAWGVYTLRGKGVLNPVGETAGNFLLALPPALILGLLFLPYLRMGLAGAGYAVASGALASGLGYVVWYAALRGLTVTRASIVQLGVPVLAAFGGVIFLHELITLRLGIAALAILGGIMLVVVGKHEK